jgi:hypothetical protein
MLGCQELTVMWLLSQYSSQQCGVYTYILAVAIGRVIGEPKIDLYLIFEVYILYQLLF